MDEPATPKRQRPPARRILSAALLVLIFLGSLGYVLISRPQLPVTVILIVLAGVAAAVFAAYFIPNSLSERAKRSVAVGVATVGLITSLLAPVINDGGDLVPTQQSPSPSPSPFSQESEKEPFAVDLRMKGSYGCESFMIERSALPSVPDGDDLSAEWVYTHGGASLPGIYSLVARGTSEEPVVLDGLRVIDFKATPAPEDVSVLLPCGAFGGATDIRYFQIVLKEQPRVIPRDGVDPGTNERVDPAVTFPYTLSRQDLEYFQLEVGGPPCVCSWKLALEWSNGDRSGTKILDRGFGSIRTDTSYDSEKVRESVLYYSWDEDRGKWDPPLPK